jgi:hypothetical protein
MRKLKQQEKKEIWAEAPQERGRDAHVSLLRGSGVAQRMRLHPLAFKIIAVYCREPNNSCSSWKRLASSMAAMIAKDLA